MKKKVTNLMVFAAVVTAMLIGSLPLYASEADDAIVKSFENTYVFKTYLKDDSVKAQAKDGVVTLTGTVALEGHKTLAGDTAANLAGVTRVNNQLVTKDEAATESADTWIARKVRFALLFHRSVSYSATTVEVNGGVVTLKGEASSVAQKELTAEYAADIEGVKSVKNEMTVAATPKPVERTTGEKIDDASITAQVKAALLTHRSTSATKTKVVTRGGVVTLTGIAKNSAEKALVGKLVGDIKGVSKVNNEMTIEEV